MNLATCKKCGKQSNFFKTIWERDQHKIFHSLTVCPACYNQLEVINLFESFKKPKPKNGDLINENYN